MSEQVRAILLKPLLKPGHKDMCRTPKCENFYKYNM